MTYGTFKTGQGIIVEAIKFTVTYGLWFFEGFFTITRSHLQESKSVNHLSPFSNMLSWYWKLCEISQTDKTT